MNEARRVAIEQTAENSPLSHKQVEDALNKLKSWEIMNRDNVLKLRRRFSFEQDDHMAQFVGQVRELAEKVTHEPVMQHEDHTVTVEWFTPNVQGLTIHDLNMAAQTDDIYDRLPIISGERDEIEEASDESFPASDSPGW